MVLRSSPRKRLLMASEGLRSSLNGGMMMSFDQKMMHHNGSGGGLGGPGPVITISPNNKLLESTKRLRIAEKSYAQQDTKVPLSVCLRGYTQEQLIDLITNQLLLNNPGLEKKLREELPVPDIR